MIVAAELAAWVMLHTGKLEQDETFQKLVEDNLHNMKEHRYPLWLIGNSTLEFGIDEKQLSKNLGLPVIKLCHGGANVMGSAAMLDFYLNESSFKPEYVMIAIFKDDLNRNSLFAQMSEKYREFMTWRKYVKNYSWLRSVRRSLYVKILKQWSRMFVKKENLQTWKEKYEIIFRVEDPDKLGSEMMKDYTFDVDGIMFYSEICRRYGLTHIGIVLLPITDNYAERHNREFPRMTYQIIRKSLREMCAKLGITIIDLGEPLANDNFRKADFGVHLGEQGSQYVTGLLSKKLLPIIHGAR